MIPVDDFRQMISYDKLTSDGTITLARIAAEAIRGLNWTTNCDAGLDQPSAAYDVLGALSQAAARLGQLLTQITRYLDQALAAGKLGAVDRSGKVDEHAVARLHRPCHRLVAGALPAQDLNRAVHVCGRHLRHRSRDRYGGQIAELDLWIHLKYG